MSETQDMSRKAHMCGERVRRKRLEYVSDKYRISEGGRIHLHPGLLAGRTDGPTDCRLGDGMARARVDEIADEHAYRAGHFARQVQHQDAEVEREFLVQLMEKI